MKLQLLFSFTAKSRSLDEKSEVTKQFFPMEIEQELDVPL